MQIGGMSAGMAKEKFTMERISGPPFRQIEIFHAIMTTHSISAAARLLNVSQPSLSRSLARLEDQLKLPLFQRLHKRLVPTAEALRLFAEVDGVINQIHALSGSIARIVEGQSSIFRFGATQSVTRALVPRAIRMMMQLAPELQIFLDALVRVQQVDYLIGGPGECIVTLADVRHPLIVARVIGQAPLVSLIPHDHPLTRQEIIGPGDLAGVNLIGFEHSGPHSQAIETFLAAQPVRPKLRAFVRFSEAAVTLAAEGVGIALVDDFTAQGMLTDRLVRRPLVNAPSFSARLCWNSERSNSRYVEMFGDALVEAMQQVVPR